MAGVIACCVSGALMAMVGCQASKTVEVSSSLPPPTSPPTAVRVEATLIGTSRLGPLSEGPQLIELELALLDARGSEEDGSLRVVFTPSEGGPRVRLAPDRMPIRAGRVTLAATSDAAPSSEDRLGWLEFLLDRGADGGAELIAPRPIQVSFAGLERLTVAAGSVRPPEGAMFARSRPITFVAPEIDGASAVWDFGDGNSGVGFVTEHAYSRNGRRTVLLTISRQGAFPLVVKREIEIAEIGLSIAVAPPQPTAGESVSLRAATRGPVREVRWFVDGERREPTSDRSLSIRVAAPGEVKVRAVAISEIGEVEAERILQIGEAMPEPEPDLVLPSITGLTEVVDVGGGVVLHLSRVQPGQVRPTAASPVPSAPAFVRIDRPFSIGRTEVTRAQWREVMREAADIDESQPHHPIAGVSWAEAQEFCRRLSEATGRRVRLPTEAEWEYACRAGSPSRFWFGDDPARFDRYMWANANSGGESHRVATKEPNRWGLYDTLGNVWEWCEDRYEHGGDQVDPGRAVSGGDRDSSRVLRGGSWNSPVSLSRVSNRMRGGRGPTSVVGFRIVVEP